MIELVIATIYAIYIYIFKFHIPTDPISEPENGYWKLNI